MTNRSRLVSSCVALAVLGASAIALEPPPSVTPPAPSEKKPRRGTTWLIRPEKSSAAAQIAYAYQLYKSGRIRASASAYQALVYAWPDSPEAPAAQLAYAQIMEHRRKYFEAFDEYQYLIDNYPGKFNYAEALDRQFQIANYLITAEKRFLYVFKFKSPERALPLLEQLLKNAPSGERAAEIQFKIGLIHEQNEEFDEAIAAYELLQDRHPTGDWAALASFHEGQCLFRLFEDRPNDENACNAARAALTQFKTTYPGNPNIPLARTYLDTLNTRLATLAFERARFYDKVARRPQAAIIAYQDFLATHPESALASTASARLEQLKKENRVP